MRVDHNTQRCGGLIEPTPTELNETNLYFDKFDCIPQYESTNIVGTAARNY